MLRRRQKAWHDGVAAKKMVDYREEDQVWMTIPFVPKNVKEQTQIRKLAHQWAGPFRVHRRFGQSTYLVK